MSYEQITPAMIAAAVLAGLLEWFPGLAAKWAGLSSGKKATINALAVGVITILSIVGACYWWGNTCPEGGVWKQIGQVALTFLLSFAANQGVYRGLAKRELYGRGIRAGAKSKEY